MPMRTQLLEIEIRIEDITQCRAHGLRRATLLGQVGALAGALSPTTTLFGRCSAGIIKYASLANPRLRLGDRR